MTEAEDVSSRRIEPVLRNVDLFASLPAEDIERVAAAGQIGTLEPGEFLFRAGDETDRFFVILSGAIEIVRILPGHDHPVPVAYLSPGEAIGEMALLSGAPRRSSGRAPDHSEIWALDLPSLENLARTIPGLGLQLAKVFARRLDGFINRARGPALPKELSGKLRYYDLVTVLQTLITSNQTGRLTLLDGNGEPFGEMVFQDGSIDRARCGTIEGEDAFHQVLLAAPEGGAFMFRSEKDPDRDAVSRTAIQTSPMKLLMEGMRLQKELPEVRRRLPDLDKPYQARTDELLWEEASTMVAAHEILTKLRTPRRLPELVGQVPCSTFTLYRIAAELYETNQID